MSAKTRPGYRQLARAGGLLLLIVAALIWAQPDRGPLAVRVIEPPLLARDVVPPLRFLAAPVHSGAFAFAPDERLAVGQRGGGVTVWDHYDERRLEHLEGPAQPVEAVCLLDDDRVLALSAGSAWAWTTREVAPLTESRLPLPGLDSMGLAHLHAAGGHLAAISEAVDRRHTIHVWRLTGRRLPSIRFEEDPADVFRITGGVALSSRGDRVAVAYEGRARELGSTVGQARVAVFALPSGERVLRLKGPVTFAPRLRFSPDGAQLAAATAEGVVLWRLADPTKSRAYVGHGRPIADFCFSPDGRWLVAVTASAAPSEEPDHGELFLWDCRSDRLKRRIAYDAGLVQVAFSPDGAWLAALTRHKLAARQGAIVWEAADLTGARPQLTTWATPR